MNNSLIMMTTATASSVLADGIIPLTIISRRRGQALNAGNDGILLNRAGYYKVNASISFTAPAEGDVTITAQKNGIDIAGLTATTSVSAADTVYSNISLSGIVRVFCNEGLATLTLVNSGVAITTSNVEIDVEYLG